MQFSSIMSYLFCEVGIELLNVGIYLQYYTGLTTKQTTIWTQTAGKIWTHVEISSF
jgi:hypothetical protein